VVKAALNGEVGTFIIDTGASDTIITPGFADKSGVNDVVRQVSVDGNINGDEIQFTYAKVFELGDVTFENFNIGILELAHLAKVLGCDLDGIIGSNILRTQPYTINYPEEIMTYGSIKKPLTKKIPVIIDTNRPTIETTVNDIPVVFLVDSGSSRSFLYKKLYKGKTLKDGGETQVNINESKTSEARCTVPTNITIGSHQVKDMCLKLSSDPEWNVLGVNFFSKYIVTIDSPGKAIYIQKTDSEKMTDIK